MESTDRSISGNERRLTMRVGKNSLMFSVENDLSEGGIKVEKYEYNSGISIAANLRNALRTSPLLQTRYKAVLIAVDSPVMLVPVDECQEQDLETLYKHTFKWKKSDDIDTVILPELNAAAVFSVNKDLKMVANDNFAEVRIQPLMLPVWRHLYHRSFMGARRKLYVYFHEKEMTIFAFHQKRFRFNNVYEARDTKNILYYILYVWKQLGMQPESDELHLVGEIPNEKELKDDLLKFLRRCYVVHPEIDFPNMAIGRRTDIPYDLKTLYRD